MKKILLTCTLLGGIASANAQCFIGGSAGISYYNEIFSSAFLPTIGYEIDDKWAVGMSIGFETYDDESAFDLMPFLRYNMWNNETIFFDLKAEDNIYINDGTTAQNIGIAPSLRCRFAERWEAAADVGFLGVNICDGESNFDFSAKSTNLLLSIFYKF